jgi:hypothetical protein
MAKLRSGLKYFMTHIIDYAGMYPPAKLHFNDAFSNYLTYQNEADSWMMERFIFPISKYSELTHFLPQLTIHKHVIKLSILPEYNDFEDLFLEKFRSDFESLIAVIKTIPTRFDLKFFEFKLPKQLENADQNRVYRFFDEILAISKLHPHHNPKFFVEMSIGSDWKYSLNRFTNLLTYYPQAKHLGFKLRCGGITSDSFPEAFIVANAIHLCREKSLPMKFTAGLHHPLSHFNSSLNTRMYGFFNILGAAVLSYTHLLSLKELEEMITEERADHFAFADQGMKWRDYVVNTEQIKQARENFCMGYGSCSFDEPRQDLRTLQLM